MRLHLKPIDIPFKVGDTVVVNRPYDTTLNYGPIFEGKIIQIILDGSLGNTTVVRSRQEVHQLVISRVTYDIKPSGQHQGLPRVLVNVQMLPLEKVLFSNQQELAEYEDSII